MHGRSSWVGLSVSLLATTSGCFSPSFHSGNQPCASGGECPPGFECAADDHCYRPSQLPDMAAANDLHVADLNIVDLLVDDAHPMIDAPATVDLSRPDLFQAVDLSPVPGPAKLAFSVTAITLLARVGGTAEPGIINLNNIGTSASGTVQITYSGDTSDFSVTDDCDGKTLGSPCGQMYDFTPQTAGIKKLTVTASASPGGSASYTLNGYDCGDVGQACCFGSMCSSGSCFESTCVVFGGTFNEPGTNSVCSGSSAACVGGGLGTNPCSCPPGLPEGELLAAQLWCNGGKLDNIHVCQASTRSPGADWGGAFETCGNTCTVANAYTSDCVCPTGVTGTMVFQLLPTTGCSSNTITLCGGKSAQMVTYGGAYEMNPSGQCAIENPRTLACSCPKPSVPVAAAVLMGTGTAKATDVGGIYICQVQHPVPSPSPQ